MNTFDVCFTLDNRYAQHCAVACYSLLKNNAVNWRIFVLGDNLSSENKIKIESTIKKVSPLSSLLFIDIDIQLFSHLPKIAYLNLQAYIRLNLVSYLPEDVESVLYLDCDLVVIADITAVFSLKTGHPVMAVRDMLIKNSELVSRGLSNYFNTGVLYINLDEWRKENIGATLINHVPPVMQYADQDIINDFFKNRIFEIDSSYNMFNTKKINESTKIIHYASRYKPWLYWVSNSIVYWGYLYRTEYKKSIFNVVYTLFPGIKLFLYKKIKKNTKYA